MRDQGPARPREHWSWNLLPVVAGLIMLFALASIFFGPREDIAPTATPQSNSPGTSTAGKVVPKSVPQ